MTKVLFYRVANEERNLDKELFTYKNWKDCKALYKKFVCFYRLGSTWRSAYAGNLL